MVSSLLMSCVAMVAVTAATRAPKDKPNIIMLFVDDLGYGDLGFNGHPTTSTPNIDKLAWGGKILSSWYSGCPVCSGSRAALMTGRQFNRMGVPGVFGPVVTDGLPLNETTLGDQAKKVGYATAAMGKWHLGQRAMYLPAARGFDYYLGIPYSDDMGSARATPCQGDTVHTAAKPTITIEDLTGSYEDMGYVGDGNQKLHNDPGGSFLPLVYQDASNKNTTVLEQPLDFTHLAEKYSAYVTGFIHEHASSPFLLYMPFSHVHTTAGNQRESQYAGCMFKGKSDRGPFGDALAEVDWIIGNVFDQLETDNIGANTLTFFTGDNGPWMVKELSGGSEGLLTGIYAGYWNTGKGSTWEGGMHEAGFAHWPGQITPMSRSHEVVSSMDVLPTVSAVIGAPLPTDRAYDGKDMSDIIFETNGGKSKHEFLFFYGGCSKKPMPSAVRFGVYKAYWCTGPGLGGCPNGQKNCTQNYDTQAPLIFDLGQDPSERYPNDNTYMNTTDLQAKASKALQTELETFTTESLISPPSIPSEMYDGKAYYSICCKRPSCDCNGAPSDVSVLPKWVDTTKF